MLNKKKTYEHYDDITIELNIWDTAGQERFRSMTKMDYRDTNGIIFVFDLTNLESFKKINLWKRDVKNYVKGYMKILVGTKSDLLEERKVSEEVIKAFSEEGEFFYLETSAKKNLNISEIFLFFAEEIHKRFIREGIVDYVKKNEENEEKEQDEIMKLKKRHRNYDNSCNC